MDRQTHAILPPPPGPHTHTEQAAHVPADTMAEASLNHDLWLEYKGLCADELVARALYFLQEYGEPFDIVDHDWKATLLDLRQSISTCSSDEDPCLRTLTAGVPAGTHVRVLLRAELPPGPAQPAPDASEFIWCDGGGRFKAAAPHQRIYPFPADAFLVLGLREQFKSFCTLMRGRGLVPCRSIHGVSITWETLPDEWDGAPPAYQCKVLLKVHARAMDAVPNKPMQILHQVANFLITTRQFGQAISQHQSVQQELQDEFDVLKLEAMECLTRLKNAIGQAAARMDGDEDTEKVPPQDMQVAAKTQTEAVDDPGQGQETIHPPGANHGHVGGSVQL